MGYGRITDRDLDLAKKRNAKRRLANLKKVKESGFLTLKEAGDIFLRHIEENCNRTTYGYMVSRLNQVERLLGTWRGTRAATGELFDLTKLTVEDLDQFKKARKLEGVGPVTINNDLQALEQLMRHCIVHGYLDDMPHFDYLRKPKRIPARLSDEELERLFEAAPDSTTRLVLMLAAFTAMRHQEITHLQRMNCTFHKVQDQDGSVWTEGRIALVEKSWRVRGDGGWIVKSWTTKNLKERTVLLHYKLVPILQKYLEEMTHKDPDAFLFPGASYYNVPRAGGFFREVRAAFKAAGLYNPANKPGLHLLRRTFATAALSKDRPTGAADLDAVKDAGGWSDIRVMVTHYRGEDMETKRHVFQSRPPKEK